MKGSPHRRRDKPKIVRSRRGPAHSRPPTRARRRSAAAETALQGDRSRDINGLNLSEIIRDGSQLRDLSAKLGTSI